MANIFNEDFRDFIQALNHNDVEYILVGGYAVILHGYRFCQLKCFAFTWSKTARFIERKNIQQGLHCFRIHNIRDFY